MLQVPALRGHLVWPLPHCHTRAAVFLSDLSLLCSVTSPGPTLRVPQGMGTRRGGSGSFWGVVVSKPLLALSLSSS